jgi:hypothetical protein
LAAPSAWTKTDIATEGLKLAGIASPTSGQLSRAYDWLEIIKNDIAAGQKEMMSLIAFAALATTNGQFRYSLPSDYAGFISLTALHGSNTGTAQDGASGSITLESGTSLGETSVLGKEIFIYGGTGAGSISNCTAFSTSTLVATVTPNFNTAPDATSTYMIVDNYYPLVEANLWDWDTQNPVLDVPQFFALRGDADDGEFLVWPAPYNATAPYGLKLRYYVDLLELDLSGTTIATLYKRWRNVWVQGVKTFQLEELADPTAQNERARYDAMVARLQLKESYGANQASRQIVTGAFE